MRRVLARLYDEDGRFGCSVLIERPCGIIRNVGEGYVLGNLFFVVESIRWDTKDPKFGTVDVAKLRQVTGTCYSIH